MRKWSFFLAICFQFLTTQIQADTVVTVHGLLGTARDLRTISKVLKGSGYDVCPWEYSSRSKTFEENGAQLACALKQIAHYQPGVPIHFVSHSVGALVIRVALNHPDCPAEAKAGKAVLLAPPNQGSMLARNCKNCLPLRFALGNKLGWQFMNIDRQNNTFLGEFPACMPVLIIAGTKGTRDIFDGKVNDGFIALEETALNTPYYFLSYPFTHGDLLKKRVVIADIRNFLQCCPE